MINIATKKTGVKDLSSLAGSILAGKRFWTGNKMAPEIMTAMLLSGTKTRSKKNINDTLENAAIALGFTISNDYLSFATTIPKGKESLFAEVLVDILNNSIFPEDEFALEVGKKRAAVLESSTDPVDVSYRAVCRNIFPKDTLQYKYNAEERVGLLNSLKQKDIVDCYKTLIGQTEINIAVAGDVSQNYWQNEFKSLLGKLPKKNISLVPAKEVSPGKRAEVITIKDKTNCAVHFATPVDVNVNDKSYLALQCLIRVLGGDFVSRLMSEVREKQGLTYHIGARVDGIRKGDTGLLVVYGNFAPSLHDKGIRATEEVLKKMFDKGVKPSELDRVKVAIAGRYKVGLSTAVGTAAELLNCLELGRLPSYIDEYPSLIASVTMKDVRQVVKALQGKPFYRVSAGSL